MRRTREYLAASHLMPSMFADYIGYGRSSVQHFLDGSYHRVAGTDKHIRRKIEQFLDANPVAAAEEETGCFYETENATAMREWFHHALGLGKKRGRLAPVYAGPGSGKTYIVQHLIAQLNRDYLHAPNRPRAFYVYCSQGETKRTLTIKMLHAAALPVHSTTQGNLMSARYALRNSRTLWVFDEAQHLSLECIEIVRELTDLKPYFGALVLGSHQLRVYFERNAAQTEQWRSRARKASAELPGDSRETLAAIFRQELGAVIDFTGPRGEAKLNGLLDACRVEDIFAKPARKYYSARRAFDAIEDARDRVAQKGPVQ